MYVDAQLHVSVSTAIPFLQHGGKHYITFTKLRQHYRTPLFSLVDVFLGSNKLFFLIFTLSFFVALDGNRLPSGFLVFTTDPFAALRKYLNMS